MLRTELIKYLKENDIDVVAVKEGRIENPFPIGRRAVYELYRGATISDSHKWKMYKFLCQK